MVLTTLQEVPVDGVVVVTTPFHASVSDTSRTVELFRDNDVPVLGTVVNMAEYVCDCCGEPNDLFTGDALGDLDAEVLAELPSRTTCRGRQHSAACPTQSQFGGRRRVRPRHRRRSRRRPDRRYPGLQPQERKDRVRERFTALDSGEPFVLVSDRDPRRSDSSWAGLRRRHVRPSTRSKSVGNARGLGAETAMPRYRAGSKQ